ncbi:MAG: adenosylcobinamide-phosphate synthase CbiB [Syntrophaceticus sp.]|jgi:adenosylcobinamide-phosphate synthase|nr:adenosylcobinamide-phosphate synthase CbiB [Eubacteriales bacterium]MDD3315810.1 adenosylcobinamide-phosphate synthase CbiB [Syntrophaceticus sp.]MDD4360806.1 adenosylcobinamide-phosphate synthase CbiB [Syntrophaceticus sp.]
MFTEIALVTLLLAVVIDILIGDPQTPYHPVALAGRWISKSEEVVYKKEASSGHQRLAGTLLVLVNVLLVFLLAYLLLAELGMVAPLIAIILGGILLWCTFAVRSLDKAALEIYRLLEKGDLVQARQKLSMIVGRDTHNLDESEIVRATVETVAENISDGVIAPLFYFAIGGVPLALAYRMINTHDSMLGYKNERYRDFGWFAARLDDVANYLPARLTALFLVICAWFLKLDWRSAHIITRRDRRNHPSPNSGYPEAAVAGALGVQLGGTSYYQGISSERPHLGDPVNILEKEHIKAVRKLIYGTCVLFLVLYSGLVLLIQ